MANLPFLNKTGMLNFPGLGKKLPDLEQLTKELSKADPKGIKIAEEMGTASAVEEEIKKEQLQRDDLKMPIKEGSFEEAIKASVTEEAKDIREEAKDIPEIGDEELTEVIKEIEKKVKHEINLFSKALRKSIMEELQKKINILESRFLKKVLKDILYPSS